MSGRTTVFSADRLYRYTLWREWMGLFDDVDVNEACSGNMHKACNFICLNPSTADETIDDPTIRRCVGYAKAWGYGAFVMTNLFAWRETSPALMVKQPQPVGPENDGWLLRIAQETGRVVIAWGADGEHLGRGAAVRRLLQDHRIQLHHLGRCQNGEPKHPLYLAKTLPPLRWT